MKSDENSREVLDRRVTQQGEIQLQRRGTGIYEIIYNGVFLMASYNDHSERLLAKATIERLPPRTGGYRILVGGLGMGFTLQAVLACPQVACAVVIEIEEVITDWSRRYFSKLNGEVLEDPRVVLVHSDLFDFLSHTRERFDAVLVDVDNGPNWLVLEKNKRLYERGMLRKIKRTLTPQGLLATWSAQPDAEYSKKLNRIFPKTETIRLREPVSSKGVSLVYLGRAS